MISYVVLVFFFKQKTAYEMRISDWSSDVCSSDLPAERRHRLLLAVGRRAGAGAAELPRRRRHHGCQLRRRRHGRALRPPARRPARPEPVRVGPEVPGPDEARPGAADPEVQAFRRSEEHTSELQSLMRISYAVFCLKKKKHNHTHK